MRWRAAADQWQPAIDSGSGSSHVPPISSGWGWSIMAGSKFPSGDTRQGDLFSSTAEAESARAGVKPNADRALIEQLIAETELYTTSQAFTELLKFVSKLRGFAPFNAMLLHIQK